MSDIFVTEEQLKEILANGAVRLVVAGSTEFKHLYTAEFIEENSDDCK